MQSNKARHKEDKNMNINKHKSPKKFILHYKMVIERERKERRRKSKRQMNKQLEV